jgi:hypothetical protein
VLEAYGIRCPRLEVAHDVAGVEAAAARAGGPVAVKHDGAAFQHPRLHDLIELIVHQPRIALRYDVHTRAAERIEQPMRARREQTAELAVAEEQTDFVTTNHQPTQHDAPLNPEPWWE